MLGNTFQQPVTNAWVVTKSAIAVPQLTAAPAAPITYSYTTQFATCLALKGISLNLIICK